MGKGKGRQSGNFGSKRERAVHVTESQQNRYREERRVTGVVPPPTGLTPHRMLPHQGGGSLNSIHIQHQQQHRRPRLTNLSHLKGILRERQYEESWELMERRRRAGFLPPRPQISHDDSTAISSKLDDHPPGWILHHGKKDKSLREEEEEEGSSSSSSSFIFESLELKCLKILSRYILEYLESMGREELHTALSFLSSEMLSELSIEVSKGKGISNDLAYCIGNHTHVEELSFRSMNTTTSEKHDGCYDSLTDEGLFELVPRLPTSNNNTDYVEEELITTTTTVVDDWEDAYEEYMHDEDVFQRHELPLDALQLDGVNVGLKRLELLDCLDLSAVSVLALLKKCSCITHLSLSGSIQAIDDGIEVLHSLPELLPDLMILDVTRCDWITATLLTEMKDAYCIRYAFRPPPIIFSQGFLPV